MNCEIIAQVSLGTVADWFSALGTIGAGVVAFFALNYAKRAYESQSKQLEIQQDQMDSQAVQIDMQRRLYDEDMINRKRLRMAHGPLFQIVKFTSFIDGLELAGGAVFPANSILNEGAYSAAKGIQSDLKNVLNGYRCVAIRNYKSTVDLRMAKVISLSKEVIATDDLHIFQVSKVRRFHVNMDWDPDQMWVLVYPESHFSGENRFVKFRLDFETADKFFDRYVMEFDLIGESIKHLYPTPLYEEDDIMLENYIG